ncbi:MAG TPA: aminotransferase class I/II-fold pyridoxal phosphate-dependent enzyme [Longimicrobiaceae bacterium]|nr:aminotransferase class I/II-fold pyridoxal phosphate-dependent enzyme [Longimicrobiaceae bacterium]
MTLLQHAEPGAAAHPRLVPYLLQVLGESAPGRRVLELGCGGGELALALAQAGYDVAAVDPSERALAEARRSAELAGAEVRWECADPLRDDAWPVETADAVLCLSWPAAAADADQRRLLRRMRAHLAEGGVAVIGHAPAAGVEPAPPPEDDTPAAARRRRLLELEVRSRSVAGLMAQVRLSGLGVERIDADFMAYFPANPATETVQVVARPLPVPPEALAVAAWSTPAGMRLDLRYASDEAELLDPAPTAVWEELVRSAGHGGAEVVAAYPVDDPYGGERGAEAVGRFFGVALAPRQLTFAAGVTSLLHDLAGMADGGPVAAPELVHPDLEAWALARGSEIRLLPGDATRDRLIAHLEAVRPALLHLDRPDFLGRFLPLDELEAVARAAARLGATVVIDESPAPYLGPEASAATLVGRVDNLVVLRGFTKAYSLGGMRAAFAVASPGAARRVRELVAPMQVGELALQAALRLLAAGDVFARLRERVRQVKPLAAGLLRVERLEVIPNHPDLPWVGVADPGGSASALLEARGIRALRPAPAPVIPELRLEVLRLTVPLSDERMALFRALLAEADPPSPERGEP